MSFQCCLKFGINITDRVMRILIILLFVSFNAFSQEDIERFKIYETQNVNIHLKLDTKKGNVYMVQRQTNEAEAMEVLINIIPIPMLWSSEELANYDESENVIGRYKLYPTQNIWTFLMQDVIGGKTYQVQWGFEVDDRIVILIESEYF